MFSLLILIPILFFSTTSIANAQIVINEFLPDLSSDQDENQQEWVELYNTSDQPIDINNYLLTDAKDNQLIITPEYTNNGSTLIDPNSFVLILRSGSSFSLNNASDTINLFNATQSSQLLDSYTYGQTQENKSIGRFPDGSSRFIYHLTPTPSKPNIGPSPTPSPSPTPTPSPKPSPTPKTSSQPQSNPSPTSKPSPTQPATIKEVVLTPSHTSTHAAVLGINSFTATPSDTSATASPKPPKQASKPTTPFFFLAAGLSFVVPILVKAYKSHNLS